MAKDKKNKGEKTYNPEVTKEDLQALGKKDMSMDSMDDRLLEERERKVDFTGKALDIPGRKEQDTEEGPGMRDEENTHFSQGGERREHLEERKDSAISRNVSPKRQAQKDKAGSN